MAEEQEERQKVIEIFTIFFIAGIAFFARTAGASFTAKDEPRSEFSDMDVDILARTIWGEARGEGRAGMQAVANVILNRYHAGIENSAKRRQFGGSITEIVQKRGQFSSWTLSDSNFAKINTVTTDNPEFRAALVIATKALNGRLPDNTNGADHFLNVSLTRQMRGGSLPSWVKLDRTTAEIGHHTFLKLA